MLIRPELSESTCSLVPSSDPGSRMTDNIWTEAVFILISKELEACMKLCCIVVLPSWGPAALHVLDVSLLQQAWLT